MTRNYLTTSVIVVFVVLVGCTTSQRVEQSTTSTTSPGMVVTANPHATEAGLEVLRAGGSAVDAAIAIEATLSLVEPQSSGLAGGAFMLHYDAKTKSLTAYDGRETAPSGATPTMFLTDEGERMGYFDAKNSGLSTGVPGIVAMLKMAHDDYGKLAWDRLFTHASKLATDGFKISPRLNYMTTRFRKFMPDTEDEGPTDAFEYLYDDNGDPYPVGHVLKNPAYAETLEVIASNPRAFYEGELAKQIAEMVQRQPRAGTLTAEDIAAYKPIKREAICQPYRDLKICGVPPISSWVAVAQIFGLLEYGPAFSNTGADDPGNWAVFTTAQRLAYADRDQFVGDPDFVQVPVAGMLHPEYLQDRAKQLHEANARAKVLPGDPWAWEATRAAAVGTDATIDSPGTTHFVVVDGAGNVVSMTATVESIFGSTRMVGGMFLNNQLTDFSFHPVDKQGRPIANAVAPKKRPRSSMSPTIVLDANDEFKLATGSPGGNNIIGYVAKSLVAILEWNLSPADAVALPNVIARGDVVRAEKDAASNELVDGLKAFGFTVDNSRGENSGLSVVLRKEDGSLEGAADPRREGVVGTP